MESKMYFEAILLKIELITTIIGNLMMILSGILGFIYSVIAHYVSQSNPYILIVTELLKENRKAIISFFILQIFVLMFRYASWMIWSFNNKNRGILRPMKKLPVMETILLVFAISVFVMFQLASERASRYDNKEQNNGNSIAGDDGSAIDDGESFDDVMEIDEEGIIDNLIYQMAAEALNDGIINVSEDYDTQLIHEKVVVDYYVLECEDKVFSVDVWTKLSAQELYHIRNGIFAYCGCQFNSGYYDTFVWYEGNIMLRDFDWKTFNRNQYKNIMNICYVEEMRQNNQAE